MSILSVPMQEWIVPLLNKIGFLLNYELFRLGQKSVSPLTFFYVLGLLILWFYLTGRIKFWTVNKILGRSSMDVGTKIAIGSIVRYTLIVVGIAVILQTGGIDLSALTLIAGALSVGIGFGMQNITNNFVSGLIILFERPIKVGDRLQIGEVEGNVVNISIRSTTIITNDNISVIVPNSDFVSNTVINWSHIDKNVRLHIPVGVSYSADPQTVKNLLLEVAIEHPGVLEKPKSEVRFVEFGESSLNFELLVWTTKYISRPHVLKSELNFLVFDKLKKNKVEIPFPQRDLHLRSGFLQGEKSNP